MDTNWQNNPKLAGMDKSKLEMLQNLAMQGEGKNASEMSSFNECSLPGKKQWASFFPG